MGSVRFLTVAALNCPAYAIMDKLSLYAIIGSAGGVMLTAIDWVGYQKRHKTECCLFPQRSGARLTVVTGFRKDFEFGERDLHAQLDSCLIPSVQLEIGLFFVKNK